MKETISFAAAVQDRWLRGRRRTTIQCRDSALTSLQLINTSVSDQQRGRSREVARIKTPPRARTWSPKPSARLETRLGITPTHYAVDSLYIAPSSEEKDVKDEDEEEDTIDDISSQGSSIFMEDRHSLYRNLWEESEGVIAPGTNSRDPAQELTAPKRTPPFRRQSVQTSSQAPIPVGLFRRKLDSHRRAREIIDKAYARESVPITPCSSNASLNSTTSVSSCVEIFLLLVEPKSKVFELIELSYPRKTTTIAKILKMIPKNVSDPVLADQKYVGLCRPKKHSEPITELKAYASNNTSSGPTANICQGDIFIAIPANTSSRQMIHLAKPIVANPHIQKLMSSSQTTPKVLLKRRYTTKDSTCSNTSTCASVTPVIDESPVSNNHTPSIDKHLVNRDIFCSEEADAYFQYCEQEMKRAVAQANFDNADTPLRSINAAGKNSILPALVCLHNSMDGNETQRSSDDNASYESNSIIASTVVQTNNNYRHIVGSQRAFLTRRRHAARQSRWIRRALLVLFGLSVLFYLTDSTRFESGRLQASHKPLGFTGLLPAVVSFVVLVKLQRFYLIPIQNSMCPVMQAIVTQMSVNGSTKPF